MQKSRFSRDEAHKKKEKSTFYIIFTVNESFFSLKYVHFIPIVRMPPFRYLNLVMLTNSRFIMNFRHQWFYEGLDRLN